ncbi:hypothetical protein ACFPES_18885 [Paenibacillus sp. GCM10023248]|uniref:hypothetical protein n=1 Tax=unclassified Paenibacillus TaxID=185978 RepID=UPI0023799FFC|nr:hypothetical protein [Paenibacillus sp. MAHUQ-63]MDD9269115.1 hypothetical protein [Paenibacillus sp. MAHUQ-63]
MRWRGRALAGAWLAGAWLAGANGHSSPYSFHRGCLETATDTSAVICSFRAYFTLDYGK